MKSRQIFCRRKGQIASLAVTLLRQPSTPCGTRPGEGSRASATVSSPASSDRISSPEWRLENFGSRLAAVLLHAIDHAIDRSRAALGQEAEINALRARYASLSPREREVMALVVSGLLNKQVAEELGTSEITVKGQRGK